MNIISTPIKMSLSKEDRPGFVGFNIHGADEKAELYGSYWYAPTKALAMCDDLDGMVAKCVTQGAEGLAACFDGRVVYKVYPEQMAEFVRVLRAEAKSRVGTSAAPTPSPFRLEPPLMFPRPPRLERAPNRLLSAEESRRVANFIVPYIQRGEDPSMAIVDLLNEREKSWPPPEADVRFSLLMRVLADEAYRNGFSAALGKPLTGEYNTSGDVEVLIARAKAQVKP